MLLLRDRSHDYMNAVLCVHKRLLHLSFNLFFLLVAAFSFDRENKKPVSHWIGMQSIQKLCGAMLQNINLWEVVSVEKIVTSKATV